MTGLWTSLIGLFGVLLGAGIAEFRHWMERKDRYKVMTFEKRLQVHQEAYRLCMEMAMLLVDGLEAGKRSLELGDEAKEWLNRNCLYLDKRSHRAIISAFFAASNYFSDIAKQRQKVNQALEAKQRQVVYVNLAHNEAQSEMKKCLKFIAEGVGAEYLPETNKQS